MFTYRNLMTVGCAAVLAFGLAACGDNDDGPSTSMNGGMPTMDLAWDMLDGETIEPGTYAISSAPADLLDDAENVVVPEGGFVPGSMVELGGYVLTCSGTVNCSVTVDDDGNVMTEGTLMVAAKMDSMDPMDPMVPMAVAVTLPADLPDDADLQPMAETLMIAAGESDESGGVMFSCAADGEACVVTVDADGMATSTGGTVTATLTMAAQEVADEEATQMALDARSRAIAQSAALGGGGTGMFDVDDLKISNAASKDTSVSVSGYTPAAEQPAMLGKFSGHALMNTSAATRTDHLVVYTDIGKPTQGEFFDFDEVGTTTPVYTNPATQVDGQPYVVGALSLVPAAADPVLGRLPTGHFSGANLDLTIFPSKTAGGSVRKEFAANAKSDGQGPTDPNDIYTVSGSFDGAEGIYTCAPADDEVCTVSVASNGTYSMGTDVWTFTPNTGEVAYREDSEFLRFGWWLRDPTKATGQYQFNAFYSGTPYTVVGPDAADTTGVGVTGSATYTGSAAGRYVAAGMGGSFTADAVLEAKFGDDTVDTNMNVATISGDITNFQGGEGMSGWAVELHAISMESLAVGTATDPQFTTGTDTNRSLPTYAGTTATMGAVTAYGSWEGRFYGNEKEVLEETGRANRVNAAPLAVGGKFDAAGSGVSIAGAYGARRP